MMLKSELLQCEKLERGLLQGVPPGMVLVDLDGRKRFLAIPGDCPIQRFEFEIRLSGLIEGIPRPYGQPLGPAATD